MAINFIIDNENIVLDYESETQPINWIDDRLDENGNYVFNNTFTVSKKELLPIIDSDNEYNIRRFLIGFVGDGYYTINKNVLGIKHDLLISNSVQLSKKIFVAVKNISIFKKIDDLIEEQIIVGGNNENAISEADFNELLKKFPNTTEVKKYADARIARELKDYFDTMSDADTELVNFLNRKRSSQLGLSVENKTIRLANELELGKYLFLRNKLAEMLSDSSSYVESRWQETVAELFLLIFPQYIAVLEKVSLKEYYSNPIKPTTRKFDLVLVDANGCIDLIEIKRPFDDKMLAKKIYRDNYIPHGELSGAIMQAEKYLFYLSKAGIGIEEKIKLKYASQLPKSMVIKVASPKAIILSGRDHTLTDRQKFDLGFIRKKYSNMVDILSYDDLLRRMDNIIDILKLKSSK